MNQLVPNCILQSCVIFFSLKFLLLGKNTKNHRQVQAWGWPRDMTFSKQFLIDSITSRSMFSETSA